MPSDLPNLPLIQGLIATAISWDMDERHAVLTLDPETGLLQVSGPYPDGHQALLALERELAQRNDPKENDGAQIVGTVVLFYDPS